MTGLLAASLMLSATSQTKKSLPEKFNISNESLKQYINILNGSAMPNSGFGHIGGHRLCRARGTGMARHMYESDIYNRKTNQPTGKASEVYLYHVKHYGHPS